MSCGTQKVLRGNLCDLRWFLRVHCNNWITALWVRGGYTKMIYFIQEQKSELILVGTQLSMNYYLQHLRMRLQRKNWNYITADLGFGGNAGDSQVAQPPILMKYNTKYSEDDIALVLIEYSWTKIKYSWTKIKYSWTKIKYSEGNIALILMDHLPAASHRWCRCCCTDASA